MRSQLMVAVIVSLLLASASSGEPFAWIAGGESTRFSGGSDCGTLLFNADATYETAYAWQYEGIAPPYYGAFAECFHGPAEVCALICDLTGSGLPADSDMDVYIWADAGNVPGAVLVALPEVPVGVPPYGSFRRYVVPLPNGPCIADRAWAGLRGNMDGNALWYVGADYDGPGGCPMTNIAPGLGYPTGWRDVSVVWGPTAAVGIGVEVLPCEPVPIEEQSWGEIKRLYQ